MGYSMVRISVADLTRSTGATLLEGPADALVTGVATDSRNVVPGSAFVCFVGEKVDGNAFAPAAVRAGAACVVLTKDSADELLVCAREAGCAVVRAANDDPEAFMLALAARWRAMNPRWIVVGVTGSVGKTTTKDMLNEALSTCFRVHATQGNHNNLIGLPATILEADAEDEVVVCEMGMNHPGEIARLSACARPTVSVITNVGTSHIGFLGSREAIARAKAEILEGMDPSSQKTGGVSPCLVLNSEDGFSSFIEGSFARPHGVECVYAGPGPHDRVRAEDLVFDGDDLPRFTLAFSDGWRRKQSLDIPGRAGVWNFLLVMAVCERLGADREACAAALEHTERTGMRLELVTRPGKPRVIDDSYNASPSSVAAALDVLASMECAGRRIAVLGEVGELGSESRRLHGYMGAYAAATAPDLLVCVGADDAREMREAALVMGMPEKRVLLYEDADLAARALGPLLAEDDLVLAKGSRAAGLDLFVKGVLA